MLATKERRSGIRTLRGWPISVLQETGAIRECDTHGWMQDRADPHARKRAFDVARHDSPPGTWSKAAVVMIEEILAGIGDTCPECPPEG
jgi:hypothetical protein